MRIAILGCGAMGTVMGAFMTKGGTPVDMIDNYRAHVDALNGRGATVTGKAEFNVPVHALTPEEMEGVYDIVFLFTKQTANQEVLTDLLPHLGEHSTVCTLQNGVPEPFVARIVGEGRTIGGTVLWGASFLEPGLSELTQSLDKLDHFFEIGEMDGSITPRTRLVASALESMGPVRISTNLMASRWSKLINNACMSGMSAACGVTFGEVLANDKARACLSYLGREVKQCCEAEGYRMPTLVYGYSPDSLDLKDQAQYNENQSLFWNMYQVALPGKASMLQDLEKGKKTEVPMINGYVSETGRAHGIPTPFNDTVVRIVREIEDGKRKLSLDNLAEFRDEWFRYQPYLPETKK